MKKLLYIFIIFNNVFLLSSEHNIEYTKDTCNRTYDRIFFSTDDERKKDCRECAYSRFEVRDTNSGRHIAHIAYDPSECYIHYLRVDEEYEGKGIGRELASRALEDMRTNHNCGEVLLFSASKATGFWEKLGAERRRGHISRKPYGLFYTHVFSEPKYF